MKLLSLICSCLLALFSITLYSQSNLNCAPTFMMNELGKCIGKQGFLSIDLNEDGTPELVAGSTYVYNNRWNILTYNRDLKKYEAVWQLMSDIWEGDLSRLSALQIGGKPTIAVGLTDGLLKFYQGLIPKEINKINTGLGSIKEIGFADINNDGEKEIIVSDSVKTGIYDPTTLQLKFNIDKGGAFKIGNVSGDAKVELVYANGSVLEVNGANYQTIWQMYTLNSTLTLPSIHIGNSGGDNHEEIIIGFPTDSIIVFNAVSKSVTSKITSIGLVEAITVKDVDQNGTVEIVFGQGSKIYVYHGDGTKANDLNAMGSSISSILIEDIDKDSFLEILWTSGCDTEDSNLMRVADYNSKIIEYESHDQSSKSCYTIGDLNNDGKQEMIFVSGKLENGNFIPVISIFDPVTKRPIYSTWNSKLLFKNSNINTVSDVKIADLDGDNNNELILLTFESSSTSRLRVLKIQGDSLVLKKIADVSFSSGVPFQFEVTDIDKNGNLDIVCLSATRMNVFDADTVIFKWGKGDFLGALGMKIGNVDADTALEIVISAYKILVIDGATQDLISSTASIYGSFDLYPWKINQGPERIIVANYSNKIEIFDGANMETPIETLSIVDKFDGSINSLGVQKDVNGVDNIYIANYHGNFYRYNQAVLDTIQKGFPVQNFGYGNNMLIRGGSIIINSSYNVAVYDSTCTNISTNITNNFVSNITSVLYPNPATSTVKIEVTDEQTINSVEVRDLLSRVVNTYTGSGTNSQEIQIDNLTNGLYLVVTQTKNGKSVSRLTIQH